MRPSRSSPGHPAFSDSADSRPGLLQCEPAQVTDRAPLPFSLTTVRSTRIETKDVSCQSSLCSCGTSPLRAGSRHHAAYLIESISQPSRPFLFSAPTLPIFSSQYPSLLHFLFLQFFSANLKLFPKISSIGQVKHTSPGRPAGARPDRVHSHR